MRKRRKRDTREDFQTLVALLDLTHQARAMLRRRTRELVGLTLEQAIVLCRVDLEGGEVTMTGLASAVNRANNTLSVMVRSLETRGLVSRRRGAAGNHREVLVSLTPQGETKLRVFRDNLVDLLESALPSFALNLGAVPLLRALEALRELLQETE